MKRGNQVLWGVILIGIGLVLGLNALGMTHINLFFDGWWTLFIIVPCLVGLLSGKDIMGNVIGIGIGAFLLLCCQDILSFEWLWKLAFPAVIVLIGVKMIFGNLLDGSSSAIKRLESGDYHPKYGTAVFSGEKMNFSGEVFQGAELNAVFGSAECDLRNAIVDQDCVISATAVFGGIDIWVPSNVNVKVTSNSFFGGVSNKAAPFRDDTAPTLYIRGTCLFGGVEIK